jgi:D-alanine-D-alanine ligase
MRVLVLHSDIAPDAPPDEQDTLVQANAIAAALNGRGHRAVTAPFVADPARLAALAADADVLFNLVESVDGSGFKAAEAAALFPALGIPCTGSPVSALVQTGDKPESKRRLAAAGLATPAWAIPPDWQGLRDDVPYIVKSAREDASIGLDDGAVLTGRDAIIARAAASTAAYGGLWFAEEYLGGREFNVALLAAADGPIVLPIAEMRFADWPDDRPRIVGYRAKWDDTSFEAQKTVRDFSWALREPELNAALHALATQAWAVFGLRGYARVDVRCRADGTPTILEVNTNPCLSPDAGFAAAAEQQGYSYAGLVERVVAAAHTPAQSAVRGRSGAD